MITIATSTLKARHLLVFLLHFPHVDNAVSQKVARGSPAHPHTLCSAQSLTSLSWDFSWAGDTTTYH